MIFGEGLREARPPELPEVCIWCGEDMLVYQRAYLRLRSRWGRVLCAPTCSGRCEEGTLRAPYSTEIVVSYRRRGEEELCVRTFRAE